MKPIIAFIAAILTVAALPAPARSQGTQPPKTGNARFGNPKNVAPNLQGYLYGVLKEKTANSLLLDKTKFGVDQTIKLDKKTKYVRDGKPSTLAEIQVGDPVYVAVKTDKKTDEMTAKKVVSGILPIK